MNWKAWVERSGWLLALAGSGCAALAPGVFLHRAVVDPEAREALTAEPLGPDEVDAWLNAAAPAGERYQGEATGSQPLLPLVLRGLEARDQVALVPAQPVDGMQLIELLQVERNGADPLCLLRVEESGGVWWGTGGETGRRAVAELGGVGRDVGLTCVRLEADGRVRWDARWELPREGRFARYQLELSTPAEQRPVGRARIATAGVVGENEGVVARELDGYVWADGVRLAVDDEVVPVRSLFGPAFPEAMRWSSSWLALATGRLEYGPAGPEELILLRGEMDQRPFEVLDAGGEGERVLRAVGATSEQSWRFHAAEGADGPRWELRAAELADARGEALGGVRFAPPLPDLRWAGQSSGRWALVDAAGQGLVLGEWVQDGRRLSLVVREPGWSAGQQLLVDTRAGERVTVDIAVAEEEES